MRVTERIKEGVKSWLGLSGLRLTSAGDARLPKMTGRVSMDNPESLFLTNLSQFTPLSPDHETYWRDLDLDSNALNSISTTRLMQMLADLSPDISRALWDALRMGNPGSKVKAYKSGVFQDDGRGGKARVEDEVAQAALDTFLTNLHGPYTVQNVVPADTIYNSLLTGAALRGALFAELVLDETGRIPLEVATPDPATVRFRRVPAGPRGTAWEAGQWIRGKFIAFDRPTVQYVPLDPFFDSPYGRSMFAPALFTSLFLLGILHDFRRVVAQQGWPRFDIKVVMERLRASMPQGLSAEKMKEWTNAAIAEIEATYKALQPDDAFVHTDMVEMGRPVGTVDAESLGAVDGLIKALERMLTRALKTMPLLMGTTDGVSEANANRQWEIHAAGVKALQHLCENLLERLLVLALRVQGISADVEFRFSELRAAELMRDAQAERLQIENEARKRDEGWQTNDEAANKIVGHNAVAEPVSAGQTEGVGNLADKNADPGSERAVKANGGAELLSTEVEQ